jgi:hypothetical protein
MAWEYKTVESTDFGHPGGAPRYQEFVEELGRLSKEGWEVDQLVPTMQRGRAESPAGGGRESSSLTAVAIMALLKRKVE